MGTTKPKPRDPTVGYRNVLEQDPVLLKEAEAALADKADQSRKKKNATQLIELLEAYLSSGRLQLFHTPQQEGFGTILVDDHRETWPLRSRVFRNWLAARSYDETGAVPNSQVLQDVLNVLTGRALFEGAEHKAFVRLAEHGGAIFLDLSDQRWRAVQITATGWRITDNPPVRFRRARGMTALPEPKPGGSAREIFRFVNIRKGYDEILLLAWLVAALYPIGSFPILALQGAQGSAKSTTAVVIRSVVDPSEAALNTIPRDERDLVIAASNSHIISLDNLSGMKQWLSDALCRVATGGGLRTRELYTDSEEIIFSTKRPVITNGIAEIASRGDLLDRMIILRLPMIDESARREERVLFAEFEAARPRILGALLDAVSAALSNIEHTKLPSLPRMADFALWVVAAAPALGFTEEDFLRAYYCNREDASATALESSLVARVLIEFAESLPPGGWQGAASELLEKLGQLATDEVRRDRCWPHSGQALSNAIARIEPHLRALGICVQRFRVGKAGTRILKIQKVPKPSSASSATVSDDEGTAYAMADDGPTTNPNPHVSSAAKPSILNGAEEADSADSALHDIPV